MLYSTANTESRVEEGDLLFLSQVEDVLKDTGRKVDRQSIIDWIRDGKLKAEKFYRGQEKKKYEWLVHPAHLKAAIKRMHKERPPGGSWFKDV
jgi:hypothetical protein